MKLSQVIADQKDRFFKSRLALLLLIGGTLILFMQMLVTEREPVTPPEWLVLRPGMSKAEVSKTLHGPIYYREQQGRGCILKKLDGMSGYAMLELTYGDLGETTHARVKFLTYKHAVFKELDPLF